MQIHQYTSEYTDTLTDRQTGTQTGKPECKHTSLEREKKGEWDDVLTKLCVGQVHCSPDS